MQMPDGSVAEGTIVDGWPAPKVTKYVNYNFHLNN